MSSKSTLFLTNDHNEHCYDDCNFPHFKDGEFIGNVIILEMDKKNINILINDDECLCVEFIPGSELYEMIKRMKDK